MKFVNELGTSWLSRIFKMSGTIIGKVRLVLCLSTH